MLLYLDTCIVIYLVEEHHVYCPVIPREVFLEAAALRARHGLRTPDALHLATASHHGCDILWTNDDRLSKVAGGMVINVLAGAGA